MGVDWAVPDRGGYLCGAAGDVECCLGGGGRFVARYCTSDDAEGVEVAEVRCRDDPVGDAVEVVA